MIHRSEPNSENIALLKNLINHIIFVIKQKHELYGEFSESFTAQIVKLMPQEILMLLLNFGLKNVSDKIFAFIVHFCIFL